MNYHELKLAPKMTVYLTNSEILKMLLENETICRIGLERGKAFKRAESQKVRCENKLGEHQSQILNDLLE